MKRRVRSVIEWRRFPDEKPTSQMVLVFADGAVNTIFGNGLESFIRAGAEFVYWADLPWGQIVPRSMGKAADIVEEYREADRHAKK